MNRNKLYNSMINFEQFLGLNKRVPLYDTLNTYTKIDLDEVRKDLNITGISSLNKQKLAEALDINIKRLLPQILKKIMDVEYKLLKNMVRQKGIIKYKDEFFKGFFYLRRFGIIGCFKDSDDQNYIFIPEDILLGISSLLSDITIVAEIKQNEKVTKLLKGLLFYYGVIPLDKAYDMVNNYTKKNLDMSTIFNIIYEYCIKGDEIYYHNNYWCSKQVEDSDELIAQHNMRRNLNYFPLTEKQVLDASEFDFVQLNEYDRKLIDYLCNNYEISKEQAIEYIGNIKLNFKIGVDFNEIVKEFSESFDADDIEQLKQMVDLIILIYNNSIQCALKGHCPSKVSKEAKNNLQTIPDDATQTKVGRNDPCPCGSGKKFKNCCLK